MKMHPVPALKYKSDQMIRELLQIQYLIQLVMLRLDKEYGKEYKHTVCATNKKKSDIKIYEV